MAQTGVIEAPPVTPGSDPVDASKTTVVGEDEKKAALGKKIRERYDEGVADLRQETMNYWRNRAYLDGEQWVSWSTVLHQLEKMPNPDPDRVRLTVNRLGPASRRVMAKLLRRPLVFEVPPTAADDDSSKRAKTSEGILAHCQREQDWEEVRRRALRTTWSGGSGVLCLEWDPKARPLGEDPADGQPMAEGDCCTVALSIAEVALEPGVRDAERARWWIKAVAMTPKEAQERFKLPEPPKADMSTRLSPTMRGIMSRQRAGGDPNAELCAVLTYYERPYGKEKGQVGVLIGEKLVDQGPWPFPFKDKLNMVVMRETEQEDRWTGTTVLSDAIGPQTAINVSWSAQVEHAKLTGNARLAIPEGAVDSIDDFTDTIGEVFSYNATAGGKPEWLVPPALPQWMIEQPDRLEREIDDILGDHDISRGDKPAGVNAGVALSLLAEQDDTPLGKFATSQADAWGRYATLVLETYAAKVKYRREARIDVPGQAPEAKQWSGQDIEGATDARVPADAIAPRSKAAQQQFAFDLWDRGIVQDPKHFARVADLEGVDDMIEIWDPDVAKARRENHLMALGEVRVPDEFDTHATHIEEHNRFRKSARYDSLPDEIKTLFEKHIQAHSTLSGQEMGQQVKYGAIDPAMAAIAQPHEPPLSGEPVPPGAPPGIGQGGVAPPAGGPPPGGGGPPQGPGPGAGPSPVDSAGAAPSIGGA